MENIGSKVQTELDTGRDVLLVLHSYAGLPGCEAVNRLVKNGALQNSPGRGNLSRVVFFAAQHFPTGFVVDDRDFVGRKLKADFFFCKHSLTIMSVGPAFPSFQINERDMKIYKTPFEDFFNDSKTKEEAQPYIDEIKEMFYIPGGGVISTDDWTQVPRTILGCTEDRSLNAEVLKQMWHGHEDEIQWIECGHTPFFAKPDQIADVLRDAAMAQ